MFYGTASWTLLLALLAPATFTSISCAAKQSQLPVIVANDNRTPALNLKDGILNLRLELRQARWYAEGADGVYEDIYAFGEEGHAPQSSGPLLRVPQGTRIHISLHNQSANQPHFDNLASSFDKRVKNIVSEGATYSGAF